MYLNTTPRQRSLGAFKMRPGLDGSSRLLRSAQRRQSWSMNGLRGLGDGNPMDVYTPMYASDPTAVITMQYPPTPTSSGAQPNLPANNVPQVLQNIYTAAMPDYNPLDYVSPQAAIAAGLNSQVVYDAWAQGLAKYSTQQAAVAAGIPSGVVTQLWASSRTYVGTAPTSWWSGTTLGTSNWLLVGAAGILGIAVIAKGRR